MLNLVKRQDFWSQDLTYLTCQNLWKQNICGLCAYPSSHNKYWNNTWLCKQLIFSIWYIYYISLQTVIMSSLTVYHRKKSLSSRMLNKPTLSFKMVYKLKHGGNFILFQNKTSKLSWRELNRHWAFKSFFSMFLIVL